MSTEEKHRDREEAISLARSKAGDGARIEFAEAPRSYAGRVLGTTDRHVVQEHAGRSGSVVLHDRLALSARGDLTGKEVEIRYTHSRAGLVREDLTEADRALTRFERAARDERDAILAREPRDGDGAKTASLAGRAEAFAEARSRLGAGERFALDRLERFERKGGGLFERPRGPRSCVANGR